MPLSKRNPLRKIPRDAKAAYLRSLRRQLSKALAEESKASGEMFARTHDYREEGGRSLAEWERAYAERRRAQRTITVVRGSPRRK